METSENNSNIDAENNTLKTNPQENVLDSRNVLRLSSSILWTRCPGFRSQLYESQKQLQSQIKSQLQTSLTLKIQQSQSLSQSESQLISQQTHTQSQLQTQSLPQSRSQLISPSQILPESQIQSSNLQNKNRDFKIKYFDENGSSEDDYFVFNNPMNAHENENRKNLSEKKLIEKVTDIESEILDENESKDLCVNESEIIRTQYRTFAFSVSHETLLYVTRYIHTGILLFPNLSNSHSLTLCLELLRFSVELGLESLADEVSQCQSVCCSKRHSVCVCECE